MLDTLKHSLLQQFGASIEMLCNAIEMCPPEHWDTKDSFWYHAYHCLFFTDYYFSFPPIDFRPPLLFDLSEFEDRMPSRTYSKDEVLEYVAFCRKKGHSFITNLKEENIGMYWENESKTMKYPIVEIIIYNIRHIQHHAAQLNLLLRQNIHQAPDWVFDASFDKC